MRASPPVSDIDREIEVQQISIFVSQRVTQLRRRLGWSQTELAHRAGWTTNGPVHRIESNTNPQICTILVLVRIAYALGVTLKEFFDETDPSRP